MAVQRHLREGANPARKDMVMRLNEAAAKGDTGIVAALLLHSADPGSQPSMCVDSAPAVQGAASTLLDAFRGSHVPRQALLDSFDALPASLQRPVVWTLRHRQVACMGVSVEASLQERLAVLGGLGAPLASGWALRHPPPNQPPQLSPGLPASSSRACSCEGSTSSSAPQRHKVVFSPCIAIRSEPGGLLLRRSARGETLDLHEWDETREWRRCRISAPEVAVDGWVLMEHPCLGKLLEPIHAEDSLAGEQPAATIGQRADPVRSRTPLISTGPSPACLGQRAAALESCEEAASPSGDTVASAGGGGSAASAGGWASSPHGATGGGAAPSAPVAEVGGYLNESRLTEAVRKQDLDEVLKCLQSGEDPNYRDALGETALFEATANGDLEIMAALLVHGADAAIQSYAGASCRTFAEDAPTQTILDLFGEAQVDRDLRDEVLAMLDPEVRHAVLQKLGVC